MSPHQPAREIELKLRVAPDALRRLAAHSLMKGAGRPVTERLRSIYFDTPALDLRRLGIALRVRNVGGRWVQTVKGGGTVHAGLHDRAECEAQVGGPEPEIDRIHDKMLARALSPQRIRDELKPVFVTDFRRSRRLLALARGTSVEASIDHGVIQSGRHRDRFAELELELKSGDSSELYQLALKLQQEVPLALESRSKAARGYALHHAERLCPVKARAADLGPEMTVGDAFAAVMWASLAHLDANETGMLEGKDPEFLHQMRVALRRLRSALSVFSPPVPETEATPLAKELKWLASCLGPARDWDVFATETLPPIDAEFGTHGELRAFSTRCRELRRQANTKARRAVRAVRYQRLVLRLAGWIAAEVWHAKPQNMPADDLRKPVSEFATAVLEQRYRQVCRRGRRLDERSPAELHKLRIAIKKFRYATDFFASLYEGKTARDTLKRLGDLQDILGTMNDAATVSSLIRQGFTGFRARPVLEARGILLGWSRGRAVTLKRELKRVWKAFRAAERFW